MSVVQQSLFRTKIILLVILGVLVSFWLSTKEIYSKWDGVPPVPTYKGALMMTLGDHEFSYRFLAITLQNFGNVGRNFAPLKNYDYKALGKWFDLLHSLDPVSDHVPMLAAYYFGGTYVPKDARVVANYLGKIGQVPVGKKWRWLAHGAYLAQHRVYDLNMALDLAYKLSRMSREGVEMPQWARHMPGFLLNVKGEKEASRKMLENMLVTETNMHPAEVNTIKAYLIDQVGVNPKEVDLLIRMRAEGVNAK